MAFTPIVTVNVSRTIAPAPLTLQRTGAIVSQGGTTLGAGESALLTQLSDLTPLLPAPAAITSLTWLASVVTVTTTAPHGLPIGEDVTVTIAGAVPAGYNGTFVATATTTTAFTYPLVADPGAETTPGTFVNGQRNEVTAAATQFFSQGRTTAVYVLELGPGDAAAGIADLGAYITANPLKYYTYLTPRNWDFDAQADLIALAKQHESNTGLVYFYVTVDPANIDNWTPLIDGVYVGVKSAVLMQQNETILPLEFDAAALMYRILSQNPSNTNKVPPTAFAYMLSTTPLDATGPTLTELKNRNVNYIGTGAEGGIANTIVYWGTTGDGRDIAYWYSIDWVQLNIQRDLANAVINGSNNPINPLYYDQPGIDRLQARAQATMDRGITYGLVLASVETRVQAVPFIQYTTDNPADFPIGKYAGLSVSYTPNRGFKEIIFNVNVTDFITA